MNNLNKRVSRKKKRKVVLTLRGRILLGTVILFLVCMMAYGMKEIYNNNDSVKAVYANVTGDIINVSPKISGKISDLNVKDGDFVSENEVLFTLDTQLLKNQVDEAYAQQQIAFEELERAGGGLKGDLQTENKKKNKAVDITMLQNAVKAAQSKYNLSKLALSNSNVLAPVDGTIIQSLAHVGDYVSPEHGVMSIVNLKNLDITAYIKQQELDKIRNGNTAKITLATMKNRKYIGQVISIGKATANMTDTNDDQNIINVKKLGEFIPITIAFKYSNEKLVPGMEAKVILETNK